VRQQNSNKIAKGVFGIGIGSASDRLAT
jgi:hypothetical protein